MEAVRAAERDRAVELPNHLFFALNVPAGVPGTAPALCAASALTSVQASVWTASSCSWCRRRSWCTRSVSPGAARSALRGIRVRLSVRGVAALTRGAGATQRELCAAQRTLLAHTAPVAALASGTRLDAGTYTYAVQWTLPDDLPPSFEDDGDGVGSALPVLDALSHLPRTLAAERARIRYVATAALAYASAASPDAPRTRPPLCCGAC